uniref:Uncharacterized protein n=1 Tax=Panagrolaimus davidi TaxID=227884 RepID=A0A914PZ76_9BILA
MTALIIFGFIGFTAFTIFAVSHFGRYGLFYFIGVFFLGIAAILHIVSFIIINNARKCIAETQNLRPIPPIYPQTSVTSNPQQSYPATNYPPQTNPVYSPSQQYNYPSQQYPTAPEYPVYPEQKL